MAEYIEREAAIEAVKQERKYIGKFSFEEERAWSLGFHQGISFALADISSIPAADVRPVPDGGIGEMSDGYHTFNGLYYQRMVLFAALVKAHKDKAWKSWRHEDGELCFGGGWFIVGIDTPEGNYTYHYEDKDWDRFECEELHVAKHWDGHTEKDVTRLLSLDVQPVVRGGWGYRWKIHGDWRRPTELFPCSVCGFENTSATNFCPNCGADMREES